MRSLLPEPNATDQATLDAGRELYDKSPTSTPSRDQIRQLNQRYGTDVTTAFLFWHFYHQVPPLSALNPVCDKNDWMIAIVPGAFYKEHPEIGGDGRDIAERAAAKGWQCEMIPTASLGTLRENADTISQFIRRRAQTHKVMVASLSKGTMDMEMALRRDPGLGESLLAWISISGVVRGTMMADWLLDRRRLRLLCHLMCWRHGADKQAVRDLRHRPDGETPTIPRIPYIQVAGFPLKRHLSHWRARLWHRRFRSIGPSDSVVLLEDLLGFPGVVLPIWGADHYLQSEWDASQMIESVVAQLAGRT